MPPSCVSQNTSISFVLPVFMILSFSDCHSYPFCYNVNKKSVLKGVWLLAVLPVSSAPNERIILGTQGSRFLFYSKKAFRSEGLFRICKSKVRGLCRFLILFPALLRQHQPRTENAQEQSADTAKCKLTA